MGSVSMSNTEIIDDTPAHADVAPASSHFAGGKFHNAHPTQKLTLTSGIRLMWRLLTGKPADSVPTHPVPVHALTPADVRKAPDLSLWRLGHSTVLLKIAGVYWLTDPVFAERASPVGFLGPKRFHAPPIALNALPDIEAVILSHDHYDHLDRATVLALAPRVKHFVTPLGVGDRLIAWGIAAEKVQQLDWWQETHIGSVRLVATPARHFSGRGLGDGNRTLWASWALVAPEARLFFSGDSGYFDGFKTIGERLGPFDLTLIENGAYDPAWPDIHMQPRHTVQAHLDLRGKRLLPIHNGTFDLALHAWTDPFEQITRLAQRHAVPLSTPSMGERLDILGAGSGSTWWRHDEQAHAADLPARGLEQVGP